MTKIEFLRLRIAYLDLKIAEQNLFDAFAEDLPGDLKAAMTALRNARAIDPEISTGLGRDREITLGHLHDAIFALKVRMRTRGRTPEEVRAKAQAYLSKQAGRDVNP